MTLGLSIFGIVLAFICLIVLTYKGLHIAWVSVLAALIIIVTSGLALGETWTATIGDGIGHMAGTLIPMFLAGATLGKLFTLTGAADSFAKFIIKALTSRLSPPRKRTVAAYIIALIAILMMMAGIDNFAVLFTLIAITSSLMNEVGIPRRFMGALIMVGLLVAGMIPGNPSVINIFAMEYLDGVSAVTGANLAIPGALFILVVSIWGMSRMWEKDVAAGEVFEYGNLAKASFDEKDLPPWFLLLIPTGVTFVCFNIIQLPVFFALLAGLVCAVIVLCPWIPYNKEDSKNIVIGKIRAISDTFNGGAELAGVPCVILINMALGNVIGASPALEWLTTSLGNYSGSINPYIIFAIIAVFVIGVTASMSGLIVLYNMAATLFVPAFGISAIAAHRIIAFSSTVLDSLPFGTMVVTILLITGTKQKDGYPPIFFSTVGVSAVATVLVTILSMILY